MLDKLRVFAAQRQPIPVSVTAAAALLLALRSEATQWGAATSASDYTGEVTRVWNAEVAKLKPGPETEYAMKYNQAVKEKRKLVVFVGEPARGEMDEFDGELMVFLHDTPGMRHIWGLKGPGMVLCAPQDDALAIQMRRERNAKSAAASAGTECVGGT